MRRLAALGLMAFAAGCGRGHDIGTFHDLGGSGGGGAAGAGVGGAGGTGSGGNSTGAAGAGGGAMRNPLAQDQINAFVDAHNQARSGPLTPPPSPALPPVSWDAILADSVYAYAIKCQGSGGLLDHNANRSTDYQALGGSGYVGENIYGTSGTATPAGAVMLWMSEASSYDYTTNDITAAGHYTQVVWRDSVRIGCAIVDCPALTYHNTVICDYAPGGNITGQKPY
jgi:pathogenesis-related protein 1